MAIADDPRMHRVLLFDADCVLCSGWVGFAYRRDRRQALRYLPAQTDVGRRAMQELGINPDDPETNVLFADGRTYFKSAAFIETLGVLGGIYRCAVVAYIVPRVIRDWLYDRIARNRYRLFGRATCQLSDMDWRSRLVLSMDDL